MLTNFLFNFFTKIATQIKNKLSKIVSKLPTPKSAVTMTSEPSSAVVGSRQKPLPQPVAAFSTTEYHRPLVVTKQEGWLSPTERASVSAISLSKAHYLATSRESRLGFYGQQVCCYDDISTLHLRKVNYYHYSCS